MQKYVVAIRKQLLAVLAILLIILGVFFADHMIVIAAKEYTVSGQTSEKLYESASESSKAVANVIPGNTFTILETVKDAQGRSWHHISLPGGTTGYIIASRVVEAEAVEVPEAEAGEEEITEEEPAEDEQGEEENEGAPNDSQNDEEPLESEENNEDSEDEEPADMSIRVLSNTNLRDEPSLNGNVMIVIPKDITTKPYEKIERDGYFWYRLTYLGQTGYIRADTVEEIEDNSDSDSDEDNEEETTEFISDGNPDQKTTIPKVVRNTGSTTVSYAESYDRRHKWDDPDLAVSEETSVKKRFIDIYAFLFIFFAILLAVIGALVLSTVMHEFRRHSRMDRKKRKQHGESR